MEDTYDEQGKNQGKEDKNVKRRVYDALNVLLSAGVIRRNGKMVEWAGFPGSDPQEQDMQAKDEQAKEYQNRISSKRRILQDLADKKACLTGIMERNKICTPD